MIAEYAATIVAPGQPDRIGEPEPRRSASLAGVLQIGVVLAVVIATWAPRLRGPIDLRWDAGVYYILGTSIAEGRGYRLLNEPGDIAAVQYPPLLPAIVAAHQWALGTSDVTVVGPWLRVWSACISIVFILLAYALLRRYIPGWWAALGAVMTALYINTLYLSDCLYTEIPFAAATMVFLLAAGPRAAGAGAGGGSSRWREIVAGVAAVAAYLLRTAGIAVLAAWVLDALLSRRWKLAASRAAVAAVPFLAWQGYVWSVTHGPAYQQVAYEYQRAPYYYSNVPYATNTSLIDPFRPEQGAASTAARIRQIPRNATELVTSTGMVMSTFHDIWTKAMRYVGDRLIGAGRAWVWEILAYAVLVALAMLAAAGAVIMWRRGGRIIVLYAALTYGLLLLVPWTQQYVRYLMPLAPVLWLLAFAAIAAALAAAMERGRWSLLVARTACALLLSGVVLSQIWAMAWSFKSGLNTVVYYSADGDASPGKLLYFSPQWQGALESLQWVRNRAQAGDVVATTIPHSSYAWTGMKSVLPPLERDPIEASRLLDTVPARFVVTDILQYPQISQNYAEPAVSRDPAKWRKVYTSSIGGSSVYERIGIANIDKARR